MNRACPTRMLCDTEYPFANLSSEDSDVFNYFALGYCCDGTIQDASSPISQQAADELRDSNLAENCPECPDPFLFCADARCPTGELLAHICVPTDQADADLIADIKETAMQGNCPSDLDSLFKADCGCDNGTNRHTVYSDISQAVADADCLKEVKNCGGNVINPNNWEHQTADLTCNKAQYCATQCPDGTWFYTQVPAGVICKSTQAQADSYAYAYACVLARLHRVCLSSLPTRWCQNEAFSANIRATGRYLSGTANTWYLSGSVPTGLALAYATTGVNNTLVGTPTGAGSYTFGVTVIAPNGDYMTKYYTMCIVEISCAPGGADPTSFPDGDEGEDYSITLETSACNTGTTIFGITGGALPAGLLLDPNTGVIDGIPTEYGDFTIEITAVTT